MHYLILDVLDCLHLVQPDCSRHVSARPEMPLRVAKPEFFLGLEYPPSRITLEEVRGVRRVHAVRQLSDYVYMVRQHFYRKDIYAVPVRSLPNAGFYEPAVFLFAHHLIPIFCAPFNVPRVPANAVASPKQFKLHEITFLC